MNQFEQRARSVARRAFDALGRTQSDVQSLQAEVAELYALQERNSRAIDTLHARMDRVVEELEDKFGDLVAHGAAVQALVASLVAPGDEARLDAAMEVKIRSVVEATTVGTRMAELEQEVKDLRFAVRTAQAAAARPPAAAGPTQSADERPPGGPAAPPRAFDHPAPDFSDLYRAFEDRHRGSPETIAARLTDDYLELLAELPAPELLVADLGCGRGELVTALRRADVAAVGVDSNFGQLVDTDPEWFVEDDLFDWLDGQDDGSLRAVLAVHVVEHLPLDLQVRLVFEARRVLVPGGLLVLETPNTTSVTVAATNFWVDPTHERPVHPLYLEFLAESAGFDQVATRLLHDVGAGFRTAGADPLLVEDLTSLLLGPGDLALVARR